MLHPCRQFGVLPQPGCQVERVVAFPVDAAIGVDGDPGKNPDASVIGVTAQCLGRFHPTMAITEYAVDDACRNAIAAHEVDQTGVVRKEPVRWLAVRIEDADLLHADL